MFWMLLLGWLSWRLRRGMLAASFRPPIVAAATVFGFFVVLSTLFSRDPQVSLRRIAKVALLLLLPIAIDLVRKVPQGRPVMLGLAVNGLYLAVWGFWQFAHGANDLNNRLSATLSHYMTASGLTMISGCLLLGVLLEERGRRRWIGLLALFPFAAMILTFTRSAYVGTLLAVVLYLVIRRPRGLWILIPLVAAIYFLVPGPIRTRIVSIVSLEDPTNRDRIAMARAGARMISDAPFLGVGPDMVQRLYPLYRDPNAVEREVPHLHNNILQIAAASGLPAAAAYLVLMGVFFVGVTSRLRREKQLDGGPVLAGAFLAGTALFVAGMFEYNFGDTEVLMGTLLVLAIPFSGAVAGPVPARVGAPG